MSQTATYRGKVRIGIDAEGKPIDKFIRAHSKLELETAKQACREHFILGRPISEDRMFYEYTHSSTILTLCPHTAIRQCIAVWGLFYVCTMAKDCQYIIL